jgi:exodeoxyribonuclease VIII
VVRPEGVDFRTKDGKAWRDANVGRQIVTAEDMATAEAQRAALLAVPELAHALSNGRAEVSAFWIDSRTGLLCKLRADWLHTLPDGRVIVVDLKTTADADPAEFGRSVWKFGYHRQAAHYTAGLTACGIDVAAFLFAAVTNARPFLAVPYMLDDEATRKGAEQVVELLDRFAECRRANHWPAYGDGVQVLSLPAWAK